MAGRRTLRSRVIAGFRTDPAPQPIERREDVQFPRCDAAPGERSPRSDLGMAHRLARGRVRQLDIPAPEIAGNRPQQRTVKIGVALSAAPA